MIKSFRSKRLEKLFIKGVSSGLQPQEARKITAVLALLNRAQTEKDFIAARNCHKLKGDRAGQYAMTITANWRIVFKFEAGHAYDLDYVDYH